MKLRLSKIFLAVLCIGQLLLANDISVTANVDRNTIFLDEVITYTIVIEGTRDFPDVPTPQSDGFVVISGPSQSSNIQIINGAMTASKTIQWRLAPVRTGQQTLAPISVIIRRKTYKTNTITVTVKDRQATSTQSPSQPAPIQTPNQRPGSVNASDLFLKAEVSKTSVYKGEELIVSFDLYFNNVRNYAPQKLPDAKGFWTEQFPETRDPQVTTVLIDGVSYKKATLRRLALFPTTTGELVIDPMIINCEVMVQSNRRRSIFDDFFDDSFFNDPFFSSTKTVEIQSKPVKITVKELPAIGKPDNFNGAVGNYVVESSIDTLMTQQNQALTLRYKISGSGNINSVRLPSLELPSNVEIFEPTIERSVNNKGKSIRGNVSYEYVLIPRSTGRLKIPPMNFSYFNPGSQRYQTSVASGYTVNVKAPDQSKIAHNAGFRKEEVSLLGSDIRFIIRDNPRWQSIGSSVFNRFWFWFINSLSIGIIAVSLAFRWWMDKLKTNSQFARRQGAFSKATSILKKVAADLDQTDYDTICTQLDHCLSGFISDKLGLAVSGLGPKEIQSALLKRKLDSEIIKEVTSVLSELEEYRFLPGELSDDEYLRLSDSVSDLVGKLNKLL